MASTIKKFSPLPTAESDPMKPDQDQVTDSETLLRLFLFLDHRIITILFVYLEISKSLISLTANRHSYFCIEYICPLRVDKCQVMLRILFQYKNNSFQSYISPSLVSIYILLYILLYIILYIIIYSIGTMQQNIFFYFDIYTHIYIIFPMMNNK